MIERSFPRHPLSRKRRAEAGQLPSIRTDEHRGEPRHPLIWNGVLHHDYQSTPIRIRNISATGAMIEIDAHVTVGAEPLLELSDEVSISATVEWAVGDQVGLRFHGPFDMNLLAEARADRRQERLEAAAYLRRRTRDSPRNDHWNRLSAGPAAPGARRVPQALGRCGRRSHRPCRAQSAASRERVEHAVKRACCHSGRSPSGCSSAAPPRRTPSRSPCAIRRIADDELVAVHVAAPVDIGADAREDQRTAHRIAVEHRLRSQLRRDGGDQLPRIRLIVGRLKRHRLRERATSSAAPAADDPAHRPVDKCADSLAARKALAEEPSPRRSPASPGGGPGAGRARAGRQAAASAPTEAAAASTRSAPA